MKNLKFIYLLLLAAIFAGCSKHDDTPKPEDHIGDYYIAGKFKYQSNPAIPFIVLPDGNNHAVFAYVDGKKTTSYSLDNGQLKMDLGYFVINCTISNGHISGMSTNNKDYIITEDIMLPKARHNVLAAKQFEGALIDLNSSGLGQYQLSFNADSAISQVPVGPDYFAVSYHYENLGNTGFYNDIHGFGVLVNDQLQVELKIDNKYYLGNFTVQ
jgi:hypothetical protein